LKPAVLARVVLEILTTQLRDDPALRREVLRQLRDDRDQAYAAKKGRGEETKTSKPRNLEQNCSKGRVADSFGQDRLHLKGLQHAR